MAYWLFKSEPGSWSWEQQREAGAKGTEWTGVRNFQARNWMRQMAVGERGFFYHSGEVKAVVGIVEVIAAAHPDSTAGEGGWERVDLAAVEPLARPVTLAEVKAAPGLGEMSLVKNSRLSVQPVTDAEWAGVLALAARPAGEAAAPAAPKPQRTAKDAAPKQGAAKQAAPRRTAKAAAPKRRTPDEAAPKRPAAKQAAPERSAPEAAPKRPKKAAAKQQPAARQAAASKRRRPAKEA